MTREEAIKYLNEFILFKKISNTTEEEAIECFKLAVEALQQQSSERTEERTETHACDCISEMTREERENALHCLKVMIDEEVCEECNLYGTTGTDHCEADCVRVAIKALQEYQYYKDLAESYEKTINKLTKAIAEQQTKEEPQPKTGHWIEHKHGAIEHIECSKCGIWFLKANLIRKSYCPNCGSCNGDMIKNIMRDIAKQ